MGSAPWHRSAARGTACRRTARSTSRDAPRRAVGDPRQQRFASSCHTRAEIALESPPYGRRKFSYPMSLAVVVAALIALTGGWIAWWNYRAGVENVRELAGAVRSGRAQAADETEAFLCAHRRPPRRSRGLARDEPPQPKPSLARCLSGAAREPALQVGELLRPDGTFTGAYRAARRIRVNQSQIVDGKTIARRARRRRPTARGRRSATKPTRSTIRARGRSTRSPPPRTHGRVDAAVRVRRERPGHHLRAAALRRTASCVGVFTIDFDLARLSELARELQFSKHGRVAS